MNPTVETEFQDGRVRLMVTLPVSEETWAAVKSPGSVAIVLKSVESGREKVFIK